MTTSTPEEGNKENTAAEYFIRRLRGLDRGEIAILKRNAGNTIAESRGAYQIFYSMLPGSIANGRNEEIYFLIATLYGHNDYSIEGDFGTTLRGVKLKSQTESLDHRVSTLLDSDFDLIDGYKPGGGEMAYRLRQCVKLASGHGIGVNWEKLLTELQFWQFPEKRVQKAWARSYFGHEKPHENEQNGN